jgi:ketosteroid isomerase-like protein
LLTGQEVEGCRACQYGVCGGRICLAEAGPQWPVSLFGAFGPCKTGWSEVSRTLRWAITRFSGGDMTTDLEVAYVGADLAYTVGYEHGQVAIDSVRQPVKVRVTLIYRREDGEWKLVHRHGDFAPVDQSPAR